MATVTLTIVCSKCKHDQFRLVAKNLDARGQGDIVPECVRCGSHEYGGIDPLLGVELTGRGMELVPRGMSL